MGLQCRQPTDIHQDGPCDKPKLQEVANPAKALLRCAHRIHIWYIYPHLPQSLGMCVCVCVSIYAGSLYVVFMYTVHAG